MKAAAGLVLAPLTSLTFLFESHGKQICRKAVVCLQIAGGSYSVIVLGRSTYLNCQVLVSISCISQKQTVPQ